MRAWFRETPFAVFDLETTGLDRESDRIVQIAVAPVDGGRISGEVWSTLVNPGVPIPLGASEVHGITDDAVRDAPPFAAVAPEFLRRIAGRGLVGYNAASFDLPFIRAAFERAGLAFRNDRVVLDPLTWVRKVDRFAPGKGRHQLVRSCERWGVPVVGRAHDAATDVRACWRLFARIFNLKPHLFPRDLPMLLAQQARLAEIQEQRFQAWLARQPPLPETVATQPSTEV